MEWIPLRLFTLSGVSQLPSQNPQVDHVELYFTASSNPVQIVKNTMFHSPRLYNE